MELECSTFHSPLFMPLPYLQSTLKRVQYPLPHKISIIFLLCSFPESHLLVVKFIEVMPDRNQIKL